MKRLILSILFITVLASTAFAKDNTPPPGFTALFNGRDLTGWKHDAEAAKHWTVANGMIIYDGKNKNLPTEKDYKDFVLMVDWKISKGGDSGIYLHGQPQVQIWDNPIGSGGLYNDKNEPIRNVDRPVGKWNRFVIVMINNRVTVIENNVQVVDNVPMHSISGVPPVGTIELQHHGSPLWFKNIYIRELSR
jgi:hypothetical protein